MQQIISSFDIKTTLTCSPFSNLQKDARLMITKGIAFSDKGFIYFEQVSIAFRPFSFLKCQVNYQYPQDMLFDSTYPSNSKLDRSVNINMTIFVRECITGEIYQIDEACYVCPFGTYALHNPYKMDPSKKCMTCPANAYCGGKYLSPLRGYRRANNQSNLIQQCLNEEACLGVGDSIANIKEYNLFNNLTELQKIQGKCGKGYEGNFCYDCQKGLARYRIKGSCQECDCPLIIYFKIAMSFMFIIFYIITQIKIFSTLENEDPHLALLIKIILNHFQIMFMMDLLNLGWTYDIDFYFSIKNYLSFFSEDYFVTNCMIQNMSGNLLVNKIVFAVLLLILSLVLFVFWTATFLFLFFKKKSPFKKRACDFLAQKIRITFLIFLFILYPEVLKKGFSLLNCIILDGINNTKVLAQSPNVECWTSQHTLWVFTISLPGIVIWGILAPSFIFIMIKIYYKNIRQLLHQKEYHSFMKIMENDWNKKFVVYKNKIISVDENIASKIFATQKPNLEMLIGYISKRQRFIERKKIMIVKREEIERKLNLPPLNADIRIPISIMKGGPKMEEKKILIFRNTKKVVKEPEELIF